MRKPIQRKPRYLKMTPRYVVEIPYVATAGSKECPHEYNNGAHAALHSILTGLRCAEIKDVNFWLREARRQISSACRACVKPGAAVVPDRRATRAISPTK